CVSVTSVLSVSANWRLEVPGLARDQDGNCLAFLGDGKSAFRKAEQELDPRALAAPQFLGVAGIDADLVTPAFQLQHRILQMREWCIRQTAEIDHIGA